MRPPKCRVCLREDAPGAILVRFADYQPLASGLVGHPHGLEWFCATHSAPAQALVHLPIALALAKLQGPSTWRKPVR